MYESTTQGNSRPGGAEFLLIFFFGLWNRGKSSNTLPYHWMLSKIFFQKSFHVRLVCASDMSLLKKLSQPLKSDFISTLSESIA